MANLVRSELTGEMIDTYSEAYRHECELRYVLSKTNLKDRRDYLVKIELKRGKIFSDKFKKDGQLLFELTKNIKHIPIQ